VVNIKSVAHFSIPVSDVERSVAFYRDIVGCKPLMTTPTKSMAFMDAAGTCLILVRHDPPINPKRDDHNGVHHAFALDDAGYDEAIEHLQKHNVTVTFSEDRQGGVVNGPRSYFYDPDGTQLEFVKLTSYRRD
jgi:catechol 2,3-dioxygenase-like lactoylglutathione lyase family enzyme